MTRSSGFQDDGVAMIPFKTSPPAWWEACLDCFIIYVASSLLTSLLILPILPQFYRGMFPGMNFGEEEIARFVIMMNLWLAVWSFMLWVWVRRQTDPFQFMRFVIPKSVKTSLIYGFLVLLAVFSADVIFWYFDWMGETSEAQNLYFYVMGSAMAPALLAAAVIGAPLAEELMFRGYLQSSLERTWMGFWGAAILLSLVWGLYHPYAWPQQLLIFGNGLLLSMLRRKTGSIVPGMIVHGMINLIIMLIDMKVR